MAKNKPAREMTLKEFAQMGGAARREQLKKNPKLAHEVAMRMVRAKQAKYPSKSPRCECGEYVRRYARKVKHVCAQPLLPGTRMQPPLEAAS